MQRETGLRRGGACRLRSARVIEVLSKLVSVHGAPKYLRSDYGPEFICEPALTVDQGAASNGDQLLSVST